uniref:Uncharacterized protein n=1 Tax=Ditylenchus dipsaci TaxID=166011 RepID=A0A915EAK7_9BILA
MIEFEELIDETPLKHVYSLWQTKIMFNWTNHWTEIANETFKYAELLKSYFDKMEKEILEKLDSSYST